MTTPVPHVRFEELAAGQALAALEPGEEQEFMAHLAACAPCERALAEHLDTLSHLAYAADPVELPAALLNSIRAQVRASERVSAGSFDALGEPVDLAAARRRRRPVGQRWVGVAAAAALVLSLGVWNVSLQRSQTATELHAASLTRAVELLESPSTRRVALSDEAGKPVAFAVLHGRSKVSLVVSGLPANDPKRSTYVLWQTGDAGTRPVGVFDAVGNRVVVVRDMSLVDGMAYSAFAITQESGRRAPRAPGALPVANGSLRA